MAGEEASEASELDSRETVIRSPSSNLFRLLALFAVGALAAWASWFRHGGIGLLSDSAVYVEQARNLLAGLGPLSTPWGLENLEASVEVSKLFPPGFALSMAGVSILGGMSVEGAGVLLNLGSLAILPLLTFLAVRAALGDIRAAVVGVLAGTSATVLTHAGMVATDVYSLALVVGAFALLITGGVSRGILCGLLAGLAFAVRNAHLAFLISVVTWLILSRHLLGRSSQMIKVNWMAVAVGSAVVLVPLNIWRMNVFGSVQPYVMATSTASLSENLRDLVGAFLFELSYTSKWTILGVDMGPLVGLWLGLLLCLVWLTLIRWRDFSPATRAAVGFSWIYLILGAVMLLIARSRWQLGGPINSRHALQYALFLWVILAALTLPSREKWKRWVSTAFAVVLVAVIGVRAYSVFRSTTPPIAVERERPLGMLIAAGAPYLCGQPDNMVLVSNVSWVFRLKCDVRARHTASLELRSGARDPNVAPSILTSIEMVRSQVASRPTVVAILTGAAAVSAGPALLSSSEVDQLISNGWHLLKNDAQGLVVRR